MNAVHDWFRFCTDERDYWARGVADTAERAWSCSPYREAFWRTCADAGAEKFAAWDWRSRALVAFLLRPPESVQLVSSKNEHAGEAECSALYSFLAEQLVSTPGVQVCVSVGAGK